MARVLQTLLVILLALAFITPVLAQYGPPPPLAPGVAPAWTVVPGSPKVLYAPNIPGDLFRLHRKYYYYYGGNWYRGKSPLGPWKPVHKLPKALLRLYPSVFKTAPPW